MKSHELLLFEESEILEVELTNDKWIRADDAKSNERFINIKVRNEKRRF